MYCSIERYRERDSAYLSFSRRGFPRLSITFPSPAREINNFCENNWQRAGAQRNHVRVIKLINDIDTLRNSVHAKGGDPVASSTPRDADLSSRVSGL